MHVRLKEGSLPDDLVSHEVMSAGQNVIRYLGPLAVLAVDLGLAPLDRFIVDYCGLVEEALREAGWQQPDPPPEWGGAIPSDGPPATDPAYLAAVEEYGRIVERVEADLSWFAPAEGLRTVRGLIGVLDTRPELAERYYGAVWDLRYYELLLVYAERVGSQFHFGVCY